MGAIGMDRRSFALLAAGFALMPGFTRAATAVGEVVATRGDASAAREGESRALGTGAPVFLGDLVETGPGSRLAMTVAQDVSIRMGERARLKVTTQVLDGRTDLRVDSGAVLFSRPEEAPKRPINIATPAGLIGVRGTELILMPTEGGIAVFVARGHVEVTARGQRVELGADQGTDITLGAPPSPPKIWGAARIAAAFAAID